MAHVPEILEMVPLAPLTTLGVGGPARLLTRATSIDEIRASLEWAAERRLAVFVLGGGSNVVISDRGIEGLTIQVASRHRETETAGREVELRVAAGEPWDDLVRHCVEHGLTGFECLSGIPGCVGATPIQNVGAYGQEVADTIERVEALDRASGRLRWFSRAECEFGYRTSRFKGRDRDRFVIVSVIFRLRRGPAQPPSYADVASLLDGDTDLRAVRRAVLAVRRRKGMVVDEADPDSRSNGSFFLNPVLGDDAYRRFLERARVGPERFVDVPAHQVSGGFKLSAAWLIEHAGFARGYRRGGVGLSMKHSLAIVNLGGGTAAEVVDLARSLQRGVEERFGVRLEPEPEVVGEVDGADELVGDR